MNTFIKNNWFKLIIALGVVLIGVSVFYYFVILSSQKEARISEKAQAELIEKNKLETEKSSQEAEKSSQEMLNAQQKEIADQKKIATDNWINKCVTDAYSELKTLQWNYDYTNRMFCSKGNCDFDYWDKAKTKAFQTYQNEWVPQCKLGNRVFIHYEPMSNN